LRVQYFKYFDKESNAECILKYEKNVKNIEDESFFLNYKLYIVLVKEHGVYKKIGLSNDTISMLETSSSKETMRVDFEGYSGKNLQINNYKNFNFRGKGLFTYLASVILNDIFKLVLAISCANFIFLAQIFCQTRAETAIDNHIASIIII